jgi:DNA mismatch endonuclease (patch repair protein)
MRRQPRRDTAPELGIRRLLFAAGLRFTVHAKPIPTYRRRADVVFRKARVAVLIDGCFWHGCRRHVKIPTSNVAWWTEKIRRNRERDRETTAAFKRAGWAVVRIWEHEDPTRAVVRVFDALNSRAECRAARASATRVAGAASARSR